jgi:hypothetical protein
MRKTVSKAGGLLVLTVGVQAALASQVYITGFPTDNNIYTNLNQQFPNTGTGTPGSGVGTANQSYLYNPATYTSANFVAGSDKASGNGIDFNLVSDAAGQDFEQVVPGTPLVIATSISGATDVYLLTAAYHGTSYNVTFTGTGGATDTFNGVSAPDFCNGGELNTSSAGFSNQSVLEVQDVGACGNGNSATGSNTNYYLYEQSYVLNSSFAGQSLTGISISNPENTLLVLGITATATESSAPAPEPSALSLAGLALVGLGLARRRR